MFGNKRDFLHIENFDFQEVHFLKGTSGDTGVGMDFPHWGCPPVTWNRKALCASCNPIVWFLYTLFLLSFLSLARLQFITLIHI
jgi:hypothetical protein